MSTKSKLIERFRQLPKDFTFDEVVRLFLLLGFTVDNKGKTSGSRVEFKNVRDSYIFHKPHPQKVMQRYVLREMLEFLTTNNYI